MKIESYVSEKILSGQVSCAYCFKHFTNYEDVTFHFNFDCKEICISKTCTCEKCYLYSYLKVNDCINVYVNQNSAFYYYVRGPIKFWGIDEPFLLMSHPDRSIYWIKPHGAAAG